MTARTAGVSLGMSLIGAALLGCTGTATSTSGSPASLETAAPTSVAPPPAASPDPVAAPTPATSHPATPPIATTSPATEPSAPSHPTASSPNPGARTCTGITGCGEGELCQGPAGCGVAWTCGPMRACTRDLAQFCGCNGVTFRGSSTCPPQPYAHKGPCGGGTRGGGAKP